MFRCDEFSLVWWPCLPTKTANLWIKLGKVVKNFLYVNCLIFLCEHYYKMKSFLSKVCIFKSCPCMTIVILLNPFFVTLNWMIANKIIGTIDFWTLYIWKMSRSLPAPSWWAIPNYSEQQWKLSIMWSHLLLIWNKFSFSPTLLHGLSQMAWIGHTALTWCQ